MFVLRTLTTVVCVVVTATLAAGADTLAQPWKSAYTGDDSRGAHVIGHWSFDAEQVTVDAGPRGLSGQLAGAVPTAAGRFGGGLESFPGWPTTDQHHALVVNNHPDLSPPAAFTVELWVRAKPELAEAKHVFLLDKKYASQHDYQWQLAAADSSEGHSMIVNLGFGMDSESFTSDAIRLPEGEWHHLAFTYDGAGTVRFYRDGSSVGVVTRPGRHGVARGSHPLAIGDRVGSLYGGFPGYLDEVRICQGALEFSPASITIAIERTTWIRHEPAPAIRLLVQNLQRETLPAAQLTLSGLGAARTFDIPALEPAAEHALEVPFDTSLRPDDYDVRARLDVPGDPPIRREQVLPLKLVARPIPRMPVMMWGIGGPAEFEREWPRLKQLGFTACLGFNADYDAIWQAGKPIPANPPATIAATRRMLDLALANDLGIAGSLYAGYYLKGRQELARVDREGKPYARHDCNARLPGLAEFSENVGASVAQTYGHHPAFMAALVNSEVRDDSEISFSPADRAAYRAFAGSEIPEQVVTKWGVAWNSLPDFPADRVIPDDHPILRFYRWFWTVGDGWNGLHTALHRGLKSTGRDDIWTWYDPAIRVPSIAGSGGEVDVLSQWTYTEPSPLRVGYFADEVFAMAAAAARPQRVMKMTQLFWYRSTSAPKSDGTQYVANPFDDHDPDAAYISIAPMHLRGAFWSMVSRPVAGIMYHGWSSLVPTDGTHAYKYTQPDLQTEFRRLHHDVLAPLGPLLLQVPDRPSDVAYLNSFTSQMFARRGSYGYSHDEAYLTLLHAQLQPEVILEETLLQRGLDQYRVLVLVDCDVLTESVVERIRKFQRAGGILIADPNVAPAIRADITLPRFRRTKQTADDKAAILANARSLRETLAGRYHRYAECTNAEIVTRVRQSGASDYVFVVNDHREAGTYVGQHGLVQENGLPSSGQLTVRREAGVVYDLLQGREVPAEPRERGLSWPVQLGPCEGGVYLVTPQPIEEVAITAPAAATCGTSCDVSVSVRAAGGSAVSAAIPLRVDIIDPAGRPAEFTGYHAAPQGQLQLTLDLAFNDTPGVWQVRVRELASGRSATHYFRVSRDP